MKTIYLKITKLSLLLGTLVTVLAFFACRKTKDAPVLTLSSITDTIPESGGTKTLSFKSNDAWTIDTTGIGWVKLSTIAGYGGDATISLTAPANTTGISRSVLLKLNSANGRARRITVLQAPVIYPSYNTSPKAPDASGMGSTAVQINASIKMGINLWNTMEAPGGETGWGQPVITQSLIDSLKKAGFNAIRIPCGYWNQGHMNKTTGIIDDAWLNRIKQVVQYCVNDGMYVEINRHHDGNEEFQLTGAKLDTAKAIHKAVWEQVATTLRDFDEHVMFASLNEPNAADLPSATVLHDFHQIFIDAVRSTGGKNAYRTLVLQAPSTSINLMNYFAPGGIPGMPADKVPNKLMLEFHWYSPPTFCIINEDASWGKEMNYWGANFHSTTDPEHNSTPDVEEGFVQTNMQKAKKDFVDKGIPVFLGEFAAANHAASYTDDKGVFHPQLLGHPADSLLSLVSVAHFYGEVVRNARANGVSPFLWAGVIDRQKETIDDRRSLDSLRKAAGY